MRPIPVLALPILNRYDLAKKMMDTVDYPVERLYIVDNGSGWTFDKPDWATEMHVADPGANLGWGAALNLTWKANLHAPWIFFVNSDIEFAPGALEAAAKAIWSDMGAAVVMLAGYSAFGVNDKAMEKVGWLDESYHPCYCEDSDWHARAERIGGVTFHRPETDTLHVEGGSVTIKETGTRNSDSYPANVLYHKEKWGDSPWSEKYSTPWDQGGDPSVTTAPKLSRLRSLAW